MNQLEEQKRIHDAETGTLKSKLVEQAARISELEAGLEGFQDQREYMLKAINENVVSRFEVVGERLGIAYPREHQEWQFQAGGIVVGSEDATGKTYEVLILQKETE